MGIFEKEEKIRFHCDVWDSWRGSRNDCQCVNVRVVCVCFSVSLTVAFVGLCRLGCSRAVIEMSEWMEENSWAKLLLLLLEY
jgi:hypothetical protein